MRDARRGLSLVESLVALAVVGFVMLSAGTLFVLGAREVHAGRDESAALWAAHDVLETLLADPYQGSWERFDASGTASRLSLGPENRPEWAERLSSLEALLPGAQLAVHLDGIEPGTAAPAPLSEAEVLRVTVEIRWRRGELDRAVRLTTVRT